MAFVVDNLQYYLMADVLESQFSQLLERLDQSTNFEELRHSHDIFLASIVSNTFVNNKPVNQCLTELLQSCLQYGRMVQVQGEFTFTQLFVYFYLVCLHLLSRLFTFTEFDLLLSTQMFVYC